MAPHRMNGLVLFGASDVLQQTTTFCEQQPDAEECAQLTSDAISSLLVGAGISALSLSNPLWYKAAVWLAETLSVGAADLYIAYAASVTGAAAYTLGASSLFAVPPATAAGLAVGGVAVVILVGGATGSGVAAGVAAAAAGLMAGWVAIVYLAIAALVEALVAIVGALVLAVAGVLGLVAIVAVAIMWSASQELVHARDDVAMGVPVDPEPGQPQALPGESLPAVVPSSARVGGLAEEAAVPTSTTAAAAHAHDPLSAAPPTMAAASTVARDHPRLYPSPAL